MALAMAHTWSFPRNLPILHLPGFSSTPTAMDVRFELSIARCRRKKGQAAELFDDPSVPPN